MLVELMIATAMVLLTVALHGIGLYALRLVLKREGEIHARAGRRRVITGLFEPVTLVLGLFALHGVAIWLYATLYLLLGAVPELREAVYFSTITYATIGYDDDALDPDWALVAAIEGINGIILLGWSTAFFVNAMARERR